MPITDPPEDEQIFNLLKKENSQLRESLADARNTIHMLQQQLWESQRKYDESSSKFSLFDTLLRRNK